MKRALWIILTLLILCGCDKAANATTDLTTSQVESTIPWVFEYGTEWDSEGDLIEVPVKIPDGMHYMSSTVFDEDLLFWSLDDNREDYTVLELALFDLETGALTYQRDYFVTGYIVPQPVGDILYICDSESGLILKLDKQLNVINRWEIIPDEGMWYMGAGDKLYQYKDYASLLVVDLSDGSTTTLIDGNPEIVSLKIEADCLSFEYYRPDTGAKVPTVLDLKTGEIVSFEIRKEFDTASYFNGMWLESSYQDGYLHHLYLADGSCFRIDTDESSLTILDKDRMLLTSADSTSLTIYDLEGKQQDSCSISESGGYYPLHYVWCEDLSGYFIFIDSYSSGRRLLFWRVSAYDSAAQSLNMERVDDLTDEERLLTLRAKELGEKYGLTIFVGSECEQQFTDFTATTIRDYATVNKAMDTLDAALSVYPDGFLSQLKCEYFRGIQIHLISDLVAHDDGRAGKSYSAFTELRWNQYLMVIDVDMADESTYYHEFSHIIDSYLEFDAYERDNALYSEETWAAMNPSWFEGYTYDYGWERSLKNYKYFVDTYATINPTEDRARILEHAMSSFGTWTFENSPGLLEKLDYYSQCIRQVFDTTGWPDTVVWEQYLYLE